LLPVLYTKSIVDGYSAELMHQQVLHP